MIDLPINNHSDLKNEIFRLQGLEREQSMALKQRFNSPGAIFSTLFSIFPKGGSTGDKNGGIFNQDLFGVISRFALPFALNKTLFKNSNFIIKALVGLVSQKASHYISEDVVESIWDKGKGLFGKVTHLFDKADKKKKPEVTLHKDTLQD